MTVVNAVDGEEMNDIVFDQGEPVAVYLRTPCRFGWSNEHDALKGTVRSASGVGLLIETHKFGGLFIPWGNIAAVRTVTEEDLKS